MTGGGSAASGPASALAPQTAAGPASSVETAAAPSRVLEMIIRVAGAVVGSAGGILLGLYATFWTPVRVGTIFVPVSIVLAIGGNAALIWFTYYTTRHKWLALLPGVIWVALAFIGAERTTEGDLVLYQKNWVATVYLFAGAGTIAVAGYRLIVPKPPPVYPKDRTTV